MKRMMRWLATLAVFCWGTLVALDINGTWQGTLQAGKELRLVFKIAKADAGGMKATLYSIDQGGAVVPMTTVALAGATVKMAAPGLGAAYEGKLNAEENLMTGTWTQGGTPLPLILTRATEQTAWAIPDPPKPVKAMPADADPAFEVATIKPSKPEQQGKAITVRGTNFVTVNTSLNDLITFAYGLHARQIAGGPAWLELDKFDLNGKPDTPGMPNEKQLKSMLKKLLVERFQLTFHREQKQLSIYAIVLGKNGAKLTKSEGDPNGLPGLGMRGLGLLSARNANLTDFAGLMQTMVLDRPVVDQTGLKGRFDFTLNWTPDEFQFGGAGGRAPRQADGSAERPELFTAIQEQMGLKLESTKGAAEVLVIDKVAKPTDN